MTTERAREEEKEDPVEPSPRSSFSPRAFRVKQVAAMLNLPVSTVHDLVRRRAIESIRYGRGRRKLTLITAEALEAFFTRHRVAAREYQRRKQ